ncbi:Transcriptional coactivator p100 [Ceraceosorus bombacis]|uniref:Transcriptional coactivator p100 n=1 Tax=Ceraceosorus bombacis TaxID=401625 RepID=A0A0P1BM98_9BASI|nr:Transcriptional coactivator p100 [Ceraceosorus bombacis]
MATSAATATATAASPASASSAAAAGTVGTSANPLQGGVVRSVLSGDTVVVRPKGVGVAVPSSESLIHIAGIAAPRMGSREREDEPQAFASREYLRQLLVGREIRWRQEYTVPVTGGNPRVFAHVFLPPEAPGKPDTNVSHKVLAAGYAKVHDSNTRRNTSSTPEEEEQGGWKSIQRKVQEEAQANANGLWGPDDLLRVHYNMPVDSASFLAEWKGKEIDSVVEQVRDGSMIRVRLFLGARHHQIINLSLAGVKAPRVTGGGGPASNNDPSEPFGEESKFFVESRLMQRNVKIQLLSMPAPTAPTPFAATSSSAPAQLQTATVLIGTALHPVGDIAQFLLSAGLARVVDWHSGMLQGRMEGYRNAERSAKEKRAGMWKNWQPASSQTNGAGAGHAASASSNPSAATLPRNFDAVVTRIVSGDTVHVKRDDAHAQEERIYLSSIRQPQPKDEAQAGYAHEAREFLRKRLIGKPVRVQIDYIKRGDGQNEERRCATILTTTGSKETKGASVGELLIQRGLATVMRHRRDDEQRSPEFDKLVSAESVAVAEKKGMHSGKKTEAPKYVDASENAGKANSYLLALKRGARLNAIVDFVASASRFRVLVPKEGARIVLVLAGIKAPRTARGPSEKDEAFGREAYELSTKLANQRDVEVSVDSIDKAGGFIGALYLNKTDNLAVLLVQQGLASVHAYSAENLSYGPQLFEAEKRAKASKLGLWKDWTGEVEEDASASTNGVHGSTPTAISSSASSFKGWGGTAAAPVATATTARDEYVDVVISDVRGDAGKSQPFAFSVQVLDSNIPALESMQRVLNAAAPAPAPAAFAPRSGELVLAKFSGDGAWYRAQVLRAHPAAKNAETVMIDYGSLDLVPFTDLRPLDAAKYGKAKLAPMAQNARLSFVKLFEGAQAIGKSAELYDPESATTSPEACINADLVREGWALPDKKLAYWKSRPAMIKAVEDASAEARRLHRGIFELGDPTGDD